MGQRRQLYLVRPGLAYDRFGVEVHNPRLMAATPDMLWQLYSRQRFPDPRMLMYPSSDLFPNGMTPEAGLAAARTLFEKVAQVYKEHRFAAYLVYAAPMLSFMVPGMAKANITNKPVYVVDGPAGSGKSTAAKAVAFGCGKPKSSILGGEWDAAEVVIIDCLSAEAAPVSSNITMWQYAMIYSVQQTAATCKNFCCAVANTGLTMVLCIYCLSVTCCLLQSCQGLSS